MNIPSNERLEKVYGEGVESAARFTALAENFKKRYGYDEAEFFSSPGRTELNWNHTDHNGGKVIAGSIDLDTIGAAHLNNSSIILITSEAYKKEITVDIEKLDSVKKGGGTEALLAGMMEGAQKFGFQIGGFDAYVSTNVIAAAGVSSSASFEMLVCTIVNHFFNEGTMSCADYAKIGQYAENVYWNKASGMMDQMACAVGGPVLFDFSNGSQPEYKPLDFSFQSKGYRLVIVNTGKGHADLSEEYSGIPNEMKEAAKVLGVNILCETNLENLLAHADEIPNDRAVLRAIHFFEENRRVEEMAAAIEQDDTDKILKLVNESGTSSWELLQNCYSLQNCKEQKISLTLALTQLFLNKIGKGVCRVHGGGFAGVIMSLVPLEEVDNYVKYISKYVGESNVYPMNIRPVGAVRI